MGDIPEAERFINFINVTIKMDEFLPSEMLAKIASNLSYKDVNSLLRTSKTAHSKLTPYRHILPKIRCRLNVECESDTSSLQAVFDRKDSPRRVMRANFYDRIESGVDELTEDQNRDRVVHFYKGSRDATVDERTFLCRLEGLSLHIQIIQSFASNFFIYLNDVDDDLILEELARLMRQSRSRIDSVEIYSKEFRSSHLDLITACKPLGLSVSGVAQLPDNFYNLPIIQGLTDLSLIDISDEKTVHNLSLLSASYIYIHGSHNITIDDVEQIIIQWAESKRRIEQIIFDLNNSLNEQTCMEWIEHLDNSLFEVKPVIREEDERYLFSCKRCCDCTKIKLEINNGFLLIASAV